MYEIKTNRIGVKMEIVQNVLLVNRELKQLAKNITIAGIENAISVLQSVLAERSREQKVIADLKAMAEQSGYTLEQLGLVSTQSTISNPAKSAEKTEQRPIKPKLKTINLENQLFYVEDGSLKLLRTHTMKNALNERGISMINPKDLTAEQLEQAQQLIKNATEVAMSSFNEKVDIWNEYATKTGLELLAKK
jgi:2-phospho-L-lactate guanylyltransferase (CobY/MobA/RfbA family)